jgi:hypothetical protein
MFNRPRKADDVERGRPGYLFGGRVRTSTLVLVVAFIVVWWVYNDHQDSLNSSIKTTQVPATQVVPPGFVPDPNYTWVPRSSVRQPPTTVTTTTTPTPTPTTTTAPPLLPPLPTLPTIVLPPPFGPPPTTASPAPGLAPAPPNTPLPLP